MRETKITGDCFKLSEHSRESDKKRRRPKIKANTKDTASDVIPERERERGTKKVLICWFFRLFQAFRN